MDIRPNTIVALNQFDTLCLWVHVIYPFWWVTTNYHILWKIMPRMKFTPTEMQITGIYESDDTMQARPSTAERSTPEVWHVVKIDDDNVVDNDLDDDLGGQGYNDCLIDKDSANFPVPNTEQDRLQLATQNGLMVKMLLQHQDWWKAGYRRERERMTAEREWVAANRDHRAAKHSKHAKRCTIDPKTHIYKMVNPVGYCGSAKELDQVLDALHSNWNSHHPLFPCGGPDHVKDTISLRNGWTDLQHLGIWKTAMTDHLEWAGDLSAEPEPILQDFDLLAQWQTKVDGDHNRCRAAVIRPETKSIPLPHGSVGAYANHLIANWRLTGWNQQKHKEVLYNIAWAGLRNSPKTNGWPMKPACRSYDTMDEIVD